MFITVVHGVLFLVARYSIHLGVVDVSYVRLLSSGFGASLRGGRPRL